MVTHIFCRPLFARPLRHCSPNTVTVSSVRHVSPALIQVEAEIITNATARGLWDEGGEMTVRASASSRQASGSLSWGGEFYKLVAVMLFVDEDHDVVRSCRKWYLSMAPSKAIGGFLL